MRQMIRLLLSLAAAIAFAGTAVAADTPHYPGYDCAEGADESVVTTDTQPTFTGV